MVIVSFLKGYILYHQKNQKMKELMRKKYNLRKSIPNCDICHVNNSSQVSLKEHLVGKKHLIIQSRLLKKKDFKRRKQLEKEIRDSLL